MKKVFLRTLGCPKNTVDSERIVYDLKANGFKIVENENDSDVVVINTCAFIRDAVDESLQTIFQSAKSGKQIIVTGCLPARYSDDLKHKLPEASAFIGPYEQEKIIAQLGVVKKKNMIGRELLTPHSFAYLKIADGCDRQCAFCIIPLIKGKQRSEPVQDLVHQVEDLADKGIKEFVLVAQDLTAYGKDIGSDLVLLIRRLCRIKKDVQFRLMYLFPSALSKTLIDMLVSEEKIIPYFDIPVQHASPSVLKRMKRPSDVEALVKKISYIRQKAAGVALRTTLITGFPGETEKEFRELLDFVKDVRFNHLGVFPYSREDGSVAALMPGQVPRKIARQRADAVMIAQRDISAEYLSRFKGEVISCQVDSIDEAGVHAARNWYFAPEVDGCIMFKPKKKMKPGAKVDLRIVRTDDYDLYAEEKNGQ